MATQETKQVKVSINENEWQMADQMAKKESFPTPTAWIRHLIRTNSKEDTQECKPTN